MQGWKRSPVVEMECRPAHVNLTRVIMKGRKRKPYPDMTDFVKTVADTLVAP